MRLSAPFLLALAACSPPPPDVTALKEEIKALRQESAELQKAMTSLRSEVNEATQPKLEALDAWTELTREVKRLREQQAAQPAAPAPVAALPVKPLARPGEVTGSVSGDLYWVLAKTAVENEERLVLCLYQASQGGQGFKLTGVRVLNYDLQVVEMGQSRPHVKDVVDELKRLKPK